MTQFSHILVTNQKRSEGSGVPPEKVWNFYGEEEDGVIPNYYQPERLFPEYVSKPKRRPVSTQKQRKATIKPSP